MRERLRGRVRVVRQMPKRGKSSGASLMLMLEKYCVGIDAFIHVQERLPALAVSQTPAASTSRAQYELVINLARLTFT